MVHGSCIIQGNSVHHLPVFSTKSFGMSRRTKTYTGLTSSCRYQCHLCAYSTNISTNLRNHVATHLGERPYKCSSCGLRFTQKITLQRHMLTHVPSSELPYKCSHCTKGFIRKNRLESHLLMHEKWNQDLGKN